jgi:hypothetical protein
MSTLKFEIPDQDFESFESLLEYENDTLEKVSKFLVGISTENTYDKIETGIKEISIHYKFIFGLIYTFGRIDVSVNEFINELFEYYTLKSKKPIERSLFERKMGNIINDDLPIKVIFKSRILATINQKSFSESRIITDVRPVFRNKDTEELIGQVLINNLKITYIENNKSNEFFVILDKNDLQQLKQTIERAERKIKLLEQKKL